MWQDDEDDRSTADTGDVPGRGSGAIPCCSSTTSSGVGGTPCGFPRVRDAVGREGPARWSPGRGARRRVRPARGRCTGAGRARHRRPGGAGPRCARGDRRWSTRGSCGSCWSGRSGWTRPTRHMNTVRPDGASGRSCSPCPTGTEPGPWIPRGRRSDFRPRGVYGASRAGRDVSDPRRRGGGAAPAPRAAGGAADPRRPQPRPRGKNCSTPSPGRRSSNTASSSSTCSRRTA